MIYIASDHAGFELKNKIIEKLNEKGVEITNVSKEFVNGDDYPDIAINLCSYIKENDFGIMICATGIGSSIAANKIKGIRAALCYDINTAEMTRKDNNANVLCLGSLTESAKDFNNITEIVDTFINTKFSNEERHLRRINKISEMENS